MKTRAKSGEVLWEWFLILVLICLICSAGLAGKIRTLHIPEMSAATKFGGERALLLSDYLSFTLLKWSHRIQGRDTTDLKFEPSREQAEEKVTGLPINKFCEPNGESPIIELTELILETEQVNSGAKPTIYPHCKDGSGGEYIQVHNAYSGELPVYRINRTPKEGKIEFIEAE